MIKKTKKIQKICPECHHNDIRTDLIHQEQYCHNCGLILQAPYTCGIETPEYSLHIQVYTTLITTPILIEEKILTSEQYNKKEYARLAYLYPPVPEEDKL